MLKKPENVTQNDYLPNNVDYYNSANPQENEKYEYNDVDINDTPRIH